jgi:tetratricopeptide (TPR) repeat protein
MAPSKLPPGTPLLLALCTVVSARAIAAAPAGETARAREQARLCERLDLEEGAAACRAALAFGIAPPRREAVRQMLGRHLVALEKWDDLIELLREEVRLTPRSAAAWRRLGALLLARDERQEALAALAEAIRLEPGDAGGRLTLGLALAADGRSAEAAAEFREALRLEPSVLEGRPTAQAVLEASEQGRGWP